MSDELLEDLKNVADAEHARREGPPHPKGWEPGVRLEGNEGVLTTPPLEDTPDWDSLLAEYLPDGWDASAFTVDPDSVSFTSWDGWGRDDRDHAATSRRQHSFRARIMLRSRTDLDLSELADWIRKARPHRTPKKARTGDPLLWVWSDWQIGKGEKRHGDESGVEGTLERFVDSIGKIQDRIRDLRPSELYILSLGDLLEGCGNNHYAQQDFTLELNQTEQEDLVVQMATKGIRETARLVDRIVVAPVGGNHGEVRRAGKSFTDFSDNYDVMLYRHVARVFNENPDAFGHVSFVIPKADLTQTLDIGGTLVGLAHGHQFPSRAEVTAAAHSWWKDQMAGKHAIGDADILLAGHRHHLIVHRAGVRTFIQAPSIDGGSKWWVDQYGKDCPPGTLSLTVRDGEWANLEVL